MWPAIATAVGGGIVSDLIGLYGASQQRKWQEGMASTAHQREVADMRAAGLNPILSGMGGSGAPVPGGASPTLGGVGRASTSAADMMFQKRAQDAQVALLEKQSDLTASQRDKTDADARVSRATELAVLKQPELYTAQTTAATGAAAASTASARATEARIPIIQAEAQFWQGLRPLIDDFRAGMQDIFKRGGYLDRLNDWLPDPSRLVNRISTSLTGDAKRAFDQWWQDVKDTPAAAGEALYNVLRQIFPIHAPGMAGRSSAKGATGKW